ncbi:hypothetical protein QUB60_02840 [Microcoleus sp. A2-C5]|uniref:hypothetical protein n=1 Tax=unclassified Microcoleus TaxID=2642155 RepID=UPI002FD56F30
MMVESPHKNLRTCIPSPEQKMYADSTFITGFTKYAEKVNGRFATIGFVSWLPIENFT